MQVQGSRLEHDLFVEDVNGLRFYSQNILKRNIGKTANDIIIELSRQLGVECPSNSGSRQKENNDSQHLIHARIPIVVPPTRRREALDAEKQPSGNLGKNLGGCAVGDLSAETRSSDNGVAFAVDMAVIPNRVSLGESFSYPPKVQFCSQMPVESLLYNLRFNAVKPRFVNIPEIPEAQRTKENVMAHLAALAEQGIVYLPAACTNPSHTGKCQGHPTKELKA